MGVESLGDLGLVTLASSRSAICLTSRGNTCLCSDLKAGSAVGCRDDETGNMRIIALAGISPNELWIIALTGISPSELWIIALTGISPNELWIIALTGISPNVGVGVSSRVTRVGDPTRWSS
jgi:hypothetical protein